MNAKTIFHFCCFAVLALLLSCNSNKKDNKIISPKQKVELDWLLGHRKKADNDTNTNTFEKWIALESNHLSGHGYIIKNKDTIWQEYLSLIKIDSNWVYTAKTPGNPKPIAFKMTDFGENYFVVENPEHDFPTQLKYWKNNEVLHAEISGKEKVKKYEFKPFNQ